MKRHMIRLLSSLLSVLISLSVLSSFVLSSAAYEDARRVRSISYFDGGRDEITMQDESSRVQGTKRGYAMLTHYSGKALATWRVKLTGTFTYNGSTSSCYSAKTTISFYEDGLSTISEYTRYSGNTAYTTVIIGQKFLNVPLPAGYANLSVSCDKDGNLS